MIVSPSRVVEVPLPLKLILSALFSFLLTFAFLPIFAAMLSLTFSSAFLLIAAPLTGSYRWNWGRVRRLVWLHIAICLLCGIRDFLHGVKSSTGPFRLRTPLRHVLGSSQGLLCLFESVPPEHFSVATAFPTFVTFELLSPICFSDQFGSYP